MKRPLKELAANARSRTATCKLCGLAPDVLAQIADARKDRVPRDVIVAWLAHDYGTRVTVDDVAAHMRERA